jgi:hypothetical protein
LPLLSEIKSIPVLQEYHVFPKDNAGAAASFQEPVTPLAPWKNAWRALAQTRPRDLPLFRAAEVAPDERKRYPGLHQGQVPDIALLPGRIECTVTVSP